MSSTRRTDALLKETQQGNLDSLKCFIEQNFLNDDDDVCWQRAHHDRSGDTVFTVAARLGYVDILKHCLTASVDVNQSNFDGKRALHEAAQHGQLECVKVLLNNGAAVDALKKADWTPLMLACTKTNLAVVQELVQRGANLTLKNKDGWNSFHIAARVGDDRILNYLLSCDTMAANTVSKNGRTPLHTAALQGQCGVVDMLLSRGLTAVDPQDSCGTTPLMDALRAGYVNVADKLIHYGADVRKCDILGREALHLAAQAGCVASVEFLIYECTVDINSITPHGNTALHVSAKEGQALMISYLLEHGCNVTRKDNRGRTALDIARGAQHSECVKIILQHCDVGETEDINGDTVTTDR